MLINCKQSTRLLSAELDRQLQSGERVQLEIHLLSCKGCRHYRQQINFLRLACQQIKTQAKNAPV